MPQYRIPLVPGQFYHIFNRGVARQPIFKSVKDYERAQLTFTYYRFVHPPMSFARFKEQSVEDKNNIVNQLESSEKHIEIISYVLMPNHFHFLLQQLSKNGIANFISQFANSYTRYFNIKYQRVGPLLQGVFKAVLIENDEQLLHLSRYIHLNPVVSHVIKRSDLFRYPWSSLPDFMRQKSSIVGQESILGHFSTIKKYQEFILDQVDYGMKLEQIKHLLLE